MGSVGTGVEVVASYDDAVGKRDSLLIAQHRAGDPKAFEMLYQLHYHRLLRYVRHRVREQAVIEDVAQEAFARAFDKIDGLRDTTSFYPWLTMIAKRLIIDHYRARGRMTVVADLDPGLSEAPEAVLLEQQQHMDLAEAMQRIRGRHREVLMLREHEGLSYEEIAERLGVPITTVPPLLHRARLSLRREYLAVTENERTASLIPAAVYFFLDAVRRLRDRALQYTGYLPEAHVLTTPVAVMAITVAAAVGGAGAPEASAIGDGPNQSAAVQSLVGTGAAPAAQEFIPTVSRPYEGSPAPIDQPTIRRANAPLVRFGFQEGGGSGRRSEDQNHPYRFRIGEQEITLDPAAPQRSAESSLEGDHGWMEGDQCVDISEPCS